MAKKRFLFWSGFGAGLLNGLLGAGGGLMAVPALEKTGCPDKESHATALGMMVPLSILSGAVYLWRGWTTVPSLFPVLVPGLLGAFLGAKVFRKIGRGWLKILFALLLGWGGIRNLLSLF